MESNHLHLHAPKTFHNHRNRPFWSLRAHNKISMSPVTYVLCQQLSEITVVQTNSYLSHFTDFIQKQVICSFTSICYNYPGRLLFSFQFAPSLDSRLLGFFMGWLVFGVCACVSVCVCDFYFRFVLIYGLHVKYLYFI